MKTKLITLLACIGLPLSEQATRPKTKRGSPLGDYSFSDDSFTDLNFAPTGWKVNTGDFNLNVDLPPPPAPRPRVPSRPIQTHSIPFYPKPINNFGIVSNSIDKPVNEPQEYVPPQSTGTVTLPQRPEAAIPVNAVASNIPASRGAVFLGSGSIGVVSLGNGAYALGSGSLGYSENRARPRPTIRVPVYPPIQATPDLLPAAVPTPLPPQAQPPFGLTPGNIDFNHPLFNVPQVPQVDQNGYEYLRPDRIGFGQPNPPRPIRTRQQFATPTSLQMQPPLPPFYQNPTSIRPQVPNTFTPQVPNTIPFSVPVGNLPLY